MYAPFNILSLYTPAIPKAWDKPSDLGTSGNSDFLAVTMSTTISRIVAPSNISYQ